ncbi:thiosulfate/3-mercaptopyruvate sulfurtransferase [Ancylobacter aquaticus]|uniref:3-mercaptopyruvate sulfurtransferase n=1 Tax=Ancylobacter aquaticus TaxID=100 RepID=A0A4R1IE13_ANCAQ|nr:3-mercaptopyruvate sulfurtransferase [Ancylobacter aquaticus]TCK31729.1 thiosulfate/3-mercaptopyruvate sulfurtransferase [Ancylobacter aquaticus]
MTDTPRETSSPANRFFVSTDWLAAHLGAPNLVIVDGSWHMPATGRSGRKEYMEAHIPGAVFFDIDAISDISSPLPHMLPSETLFRAAMESLGIGRQMKIVVYDTQGLFSAPRVWWTLRAFGAVDVTILDGGFPKWRAEGRPTESGEAPYYPARFDATLDRDWVASMDDVAARLADRHTQVLDARAADRFRGEASEPRAGVRPGHIPGARNLPVSDVVKDGRLVEPEAILKAVEAAGIDLSKPVITSCGSGVTAAILWLALESVGAPPTALYDGSWTEWGASDRPLATGPAD